MADANSMTPPGPAIGVATPLEGGVCEIKIVFPLKGRISEMVIGFSLEGEESAKW